MAKKIFTEAVIELGGHDISAYVGRWAIAGEIGEVYVAELDVINLGGKIIEVTPALNGCLLNVKVGGTDISSWVTGFCYLPGESQIRLCLQADREVLKINGTHPWEYPA